jgi:hypothetical protein
MDRVEIWQGEGMYYWRLRDGAGVICDGGDQGYASRDEVFQTLRRLRAAISGKEGVMKPRMIRRCYCTGHKWRIEPAITAGCNCCDFADFRLVDTALPVGATMPDAEAEALSAPAIAEAEERAEAAVAELRAARKEER